MTARQLAIDIAIFCGAASALIGFLALCARGWRVLDRADETYKAMRTVAEGLPASLLPVMVSIASEFQGRNGVTLRQAIDRIEDRLTEGDQKFSGFEAFMRERHEDIVPIHLHLQRHDTELAELHQLIAGGTR